MNELTVDYCFSSPIYIIEKPEFLEKVKEVSEESLSKIRNKQQFNDIYPVYMSENYFDDARIQEFAEFAGSTAWNILEEQGYDMKNFLMHFTEMWTQEHYKHSSMEQHIHPNTHVVGFYFLDSPENCSHVLFHDTRVGKTMVDLPQRDQSQLSLSSQTINYTPKPGMFVFAPSWLPHSFTRHGAEDPIKFVHFNLVAMSSSAHNNTAEVI